MTKSVLKDRSKNDYPSKPVLIIITIRKEKVYGRSNSFFFRKKLKQKAGPSHYRLRRLNVAIVQVPRFCGKYIRKFERKPKKEKLGSPDTKGTSIIRNGVRGLRVSSSNKMYLSIYLPIYPDNRKSNNRNSIGNNLTPYLRSHHVYSCSRIT